MSSSLPSWLHLASASPRRKELLQALGLRFICTPATVVEQEHSHQDPVEQCTYNAATKAQWVLDHYPEADVILGADTVVAQGPEVFNKPRHLAHAQSMLRKLSGTTHHVYTGLCLVARRRGLHHTEAVQTAVTFYPLSDATIADYCNAVAVLDKSGGYAIQDGLGWIIQGYAGSLHNVMGLPTERLMWLLEHYKLKEELLLDPTAGGGLAS